MESDFVSADGDVFPERVSGFVSRVVARKGPSVMEWFTVWLREGWDPEDYLERFPDGARFVDVQEIRDVPGWDPALIYSRVIPGSDQPSFSVADFFEGNREVQPTAHAVRNLSDVDPMAEDHFWALVALLGGEATLEGVDALEAALAERPVVEIEAFARRFFVVLRTLKTEAIADAAFEKPFFPSDSFLWWRLAVVAKGREVAESVAAGTPTPVNEDEWTAAEMLDEVAERAVERRDGDKPVYLYEPVRSRSSKGRPTKAQDVKEMLRAKYGDGTRDLKPGPRTAAAMTARGLNPVILTSRFVVRTSGGSHECIVVQRIDSYREDVALHLRRAANVCAREFGGLVSTPVEHVNTQTLHLGGWPVFEIRRLWKGTVDEYCERYGLNPM